LDQSAVIAVSWALSAATTGRGSRPRRGSTPTSASSTLRASRPGRGGDRVGPRSLGTGQTRWTPST